MNRQAGPGQVGQDLPTWRPWEMLEKPPSWGGQEVQPAGGGGHRGKAAEQGGGVGAHSALYSGRQGKQDNLSTGVDKESKLASVK